MSANASGNTVPRYPPSGQMPAQPGYYSGAAVPAFSFASLQAPARRPRGCGCHRRVFLVPVALGGVAIVKSVGTNANGDVNAVTNGGLLAFGIAAFVAGALCALLYERLLTARTGARNGQTVGKRVAGVRITNLQGGPISAGQAWGRTPFKGLVSEVFYLSYLWMLWDGRKQTWHDKVASTYVVDA